MGGTLTALIGSYAPAAGAFESIATFTGNGTASTYTFSSIPQTYKSLQLRIMARDTSAGSGTGESGLRIKPNNDIYLNTAHRVVGYNSTVTVGGQGDITSGGGSTEGIPLYWSIVSNGATANTFGVSIVDIIDYASTTKFKTFRAIGGADAGGASATQREVALMSSSYNSTTAITSLVVYLNGSYASFATGTSIALYGIK